MKIATIQLNIEDSNPDKNFDNFQKIAEKISSEVDLILLPELWTTGYKQDDWANLSNRSELIVEKIKFFSKKRSLYIGFSVIIKEGGRLFNRFFLIDRAGEVISKYDKTHLFKPMKEDMFLKRGEELSFTNIGKFVVAPTICYDLRFPEMYRRLALNGVNLFLVVAEWPEPRCDTLITLAKARAIENQAFLILSNRVGKDLSGVEYCGKSSIIYPDGTLVEVEDGQEFIEIDIDLSEVEKSKKFISPLKERVENIDFTPDPHLEKMSQDESS